MPKNNAVARIRKSGLDDNNDEPARFFIDASSSSLAAKIDGRLSIDIIDTSGDLIVTLDSEELVGEGYLNFFGMLKSNGAITCAWDMTYLLVQIDEFSIVGMGEQGFGFSDIMLKFTSSGTDFTLSLEGSFTVLGFDLFEGCPIFGVGGQVGELHGIPDHVIKFFGAVVVAHVGEFLFA